MSALFSWGGQLAGATFDSIVSFIRDLYGGKDVIALHEPVFCGNEKKYLNDCIDSTFVSSVGKYVDLFEKKVASYTGAKHAVATVNGTAALHMALILAGVKSGDEVLTQALTFVATANAVSYCGARPVFLDSDLATFGLSPEALERFLHENTETDHDGSIRNKMTGRRIAACLPMHAFGHPVRIAEIRKLCDHYRLALVEDAAESLGSFVGESHTGVFGRLGILSFNGNKIVTTGGGGMILTGDDALAAAARHITTTAKISHPWEYVHDRIGYNFRLPNINAALGCAQMETLPFFLEKKRALAILYRDFFNAREIPFIVEPEGCRSNYWLNTMLLKDLTERNAFLAYAHERGIRCRPAWRLMADLVMYKNCLTDGLANARRLSERAINLPSGVCL
jgi:perosamine synthetase